MGLLNRAGTETSGGSTSSKAALSPSESRWLFSLRRLEEELLEHILISASSAPWSGLLRASKSEQRAGEQQQKDAGAAMKDSVGRKFGKLGKNVAGKVKTLRQVFSETAVADKVPEKNQHTKRLVECRKSACNEIVRATLNRYPGSQLPAVFVSTLQAHFDSLPTSYAKAGYSSEQVFMHIRLLEQCKSQQPNNPSVHQQPAECMSRSSNVSEFSSTSSSPSSSVWEDNDRALCDEVIDVAFACNSSVSKPALVWAFEHECIAVRQANVFEKKGTCLGVLTVQSSREKTQQEFIRRVIKAAIRKSRFSKFSLALCGCDVPSFPEQRDNSAASKEQVGSEASIADGSEFQENYWNEEDFNFTSTSFANSGYEYGSYGYNYPCYRGFTSAGDCFDF